jgi:hypothetical protein
MKQQESSSFLKKRTKRRLPIGARSAAGGRQQMEKNFLVRFFKKAPLPFLPC